MSRLVAASVAALLLVVPASASAQSRDYADTALNIVPSGQTGGLPLAKDADRQAKMYDALTPRFDQVTAADLRNDFKSERFGTAGECPCKVEKVGRKGVRIVRDKYHVPHITATTRDGLTWATGWVTAEDRGLLLQAVRYPARVAALDVPNLPALGLITSLASFTPSAQTEAELAKQTGALQRAGARGRRVVHDIDMYISGINAYLAKTKSPNAKWTRNDIYALNAFKGQFLGQGGGDEARRSMFLAGLQARHGADLGQKIFDDLRQRDPADHATTIDGRFPYATVPASKAGNVILDPGSLEQVRFDPPVAAAAASSPTPADAGPPHASNVLIVSGKRSATGRPLMVGGPQIGYFYPGFTLEMDLHGPGVDVRGVTSAPFPGYMLIGRGPDFAWTLTSAGADIIDQYVETLCGDDLHYMYKGKCLPMSTFDAGTLSNVGEIVYRRTVHGPVVGYAAVGGRRVAISSKRSSYGKDTVDQIPFQRMTDGSVKSAKDFVDAFQQTPQTFNAFYLDDKHIAETTTGLLPLRAPDVDPGLPTDGTGGHEWRGFLAKSKHPTEIDPKDGTLVNWNNRVARGFQAADNEWGYGSIHRVDLLKDRVALRQKHTLVSLTAAMNAAATEDVRAVKLLPVLTKLLQGAPAPDDRAARMLQLLEQWNRNGGSRLDRDLDGKIDEPGAAILDTAWTRLVDAAMAPVLGDQIDELASLRNRFDRPPGGQFGGWQQYLHRDLAVLTGTKIKQPLNVRYCGGGNADACRAAIWTALNAAADDLTAAQGADPAGWHADATAERIKFVPLSLPVTLRYTNRPNGIQQVISFKGHRPGARR